jgi:hypothetical protein
MTRPAYLDAALSLLSAAGIRRANYAPPLHRLMWRFGWFVSPPHFATFGENALFAGVWFGVIFGVVMSVAVWSRQGMPILGQVGAAAFASILFGLSMALYYRQGARKHKLPTWAELKAQHG